MKNIEKDIIERFQQFDFDPQQINQNQIFNKIMAPAVKKKHAKRLAFAFVAVCSVLIAVVLINDNRPSFKSDIDSYEGKIAVNENVEREVSSNAAQLKESKVLDSSNKQEELPALSVKKERSAKSGELTDRKSKDLSMPVSVAEINDTRLYEAEEISYTKSESDVSRSVVAIPVQSADKAILYQADKFANSNYKRAVPQSAAKSKAYDGAQVSGIAAGVSQGYSYATSSDDYNSMQDESYKKYDENSFRSTASDPLSTFSADVDMASYNLVRRVIMSGVKPNQDSVRIEEFLNYFDYSYPQPKGADPVNMNFEYTDSPWNKGLKLVKIGVKAGDIEKAALPPSNLVFLIDVSGSMEQENRLPLVKKSLIMLVEELRSEDRVSIVTYASGTNELLSGAKGSEKEKIINTIENLRSGGGTSGSEGLKIAYETAKKNFIRNGNNRVILATDGDFNIGTRSESELENQITQARDWGVFLSVLGYGMGNYKDSKMQTLSNKGNGNYAYINNLLEARKTLVKEFGATLFTVAKDVKLQVEFNPAFVSAYRLVGYEKRALATQDFNDDAKDAGEMGAGHTVTVIYEIIPAGVKSEFMPDVESLKYTKTTAKSDDNGDVLTLKLRYKEPDSDSSKLMEKSLKQKEYIQFNKSSDDMRFAASVAQFGQIIKDSQYKGEMTIDEVISTAQKAKGEDDDGHRAGFIKMVEMYSMIK